MELDRAARPFVERDLGCTYRYLASHVIDCGVRDFAPSPREPASLSVEAQQQGEAELRRPTFAGHQVELVAHQRPTVDQFILIQLPSHARKLHPQRGVRDRIAAGGTILTDTPSRVVTSAG